MIRIIPDYSLYNEPCSIVAVTCAKGEKAIDVPELKSDGYATLKAANTYIRKNLTIKKYINYKKTERPKLKDLHLNGKAIVCVFGHFVHVDGEKYYSFFENEEDDVVAVWLIR